MCTRNNLVLTNTQFKHKMAHRSTWVSVLKPKIERKNLYRNQIHYIITRKRHKLFVTNSRSYSGIETTTDHKLVKMNTRMEWYKLNTSKTKTKIFNIDELKTKETAKTYCEKTRDILHSKTNPTSAQEKWTTYKKHANKIQMKYWV